MWGVFRTRASALSRLPLVPDGSVHPAERPAEILDQPFERQIQRRPPSDQHIVVARAASGRAAKAAPPRANAGARGCARPRCRPSSRQVNPTRTGPSSWRSRACNTKPLTGALAPVVAARKSARCLSRSMSPARWPAPVSGAEPLPSARTPGGQNLAATRGLQAGAKSMTALAHQLAGLIGPLHEIVLRSPSRAGLYGGRAGASNGHHPRLARITICLKYQ